MNPRAVCLSSDLGANKDTEQLFGRQEQLFGSWDYIHDLLRSIFPTKTAENLAAITKTTVRGWEYSLEERRKISLTSFLALLDTPHGPEILKASLKNSKQPWVKEFRRMWARNQINSEIDELKRRLAELEAQ